MHHFSNCPTVCQQSLWHAVFLFQVKNCAYFGRSLEALLCVTATIVLSVRQRQSTRPAEINPR